MMIACPDRSEFGSACATTAETFLMLVNSVMQPVGSTPLIRLSKMSSGNLFVKAEFLNPGGSIKDQVAKHIIASAEKEGKLGPGMIIIEATSGNTGIGLCLAGVQNGCRVICVMPGNVSEERKKIIQAFGGETIFTSAEDSLSGCLKKVQEVTQSEPKRTLWPTRLQIPTTRRSIIGKSALKSGTICTVKQTFLWQESAVVERFKGSGNS